MYNCFDISKEFLSLAKDEGMSISPMKLLKLVYIAQGYYLGFYSKPLFHNKAQAWRHGPVIPELYHVIKRYGDRDVDIHTVDLYSEKELEKEDKRFINAIWKAYKKLNALQLSTKTHQVNTPWYITYHEGVRNKVIDNALIESYYKNLIDAQNKKRIT